MSVFDRSGLSELLPDILETKVYVGVSAGSMVLGNRISAAAYHEIYAEDGTYGTTKYLGLVDVAIKPHYNSPEWPKNREATLKVVLKDYPGTVYALDDTSAVLVEGDKTIVFGEEWVKFVNGDIVS
jgi:dipeptidase E